MSRDFRGHGHLVFMAWSQSSLFMNMATVMHLSIETPTPGKYGALMGVTRVTKGFGTFLCPRGWGFVVFCCISFARGVGD